jgi:hypothetical protein
MVFWALVWKELKSRRWTYAAINIASILIIMPFLIRMTGWGSSLFLIIQVYGGYILMRESFAGDKQEKTLESLFATPVDGEILWLTRVVLYGICGVLLSMAIIFSAAAITNSILIINPRDLLISPLTFILLGVAGIILWRVRQSWADIIALVTVSIIAMSLTILPVYVSAIIAVGILAASCRLASDKEAIIMS